MYKIVDPFGQPALQNVKTIITLSQNGSLFMHIWVTLSETIIGFTLGTIIGMIIAILLWWSDFLSKVAEPYLVVLNSLPKIALGPIFIVWMGKWRSSNNYNGSCYFIDSNYNQLANGF